MALLAGVLAVSAAYALPVIAPHEAGGDRGVSVHAKNSATPDWILELQTRNARQAPVTVRKGEPSYWI